jgi:hypothetical protein
VQGANIYPCVLLQQLKTFKIVFLTKKSYRKLTIFLIITKSFYFIGVVNLISRHNSRYAHTSLSIKVKEKRPTRREMTFKSD